MSKRYSEIDAIRFFLALWVTIGHIGVFPLFGDPSGHVGLIVSVDKILRTVVWGAPAVIAFFIISGFCIHYAYRDGKSLPWAQFYARRYVRVLIPVAVAVALILWIAPEVSLWGRHSILWQGTLWSLVCEEIYYAVYPFLRIARKRVGWGAILIASACVSIVLGYIFRGVDQWVVVGPIATSVILFPVWISGCVLAERASSIKVNYSSLSVWKWRGVAWLSMWVSEFMQFHMHIYVAQTMILVGIVGYFWISAEIAFFKSTEPYDWMVSAGKWSYSLYLVHPLIIWVFMLHIRSISGRSPIGWILIVITSLFAAFIFYIFVEAPAHRLAKKITFRSFGVATASGNANM
ncbi:Acyl_transf_3 domain-containing protein [Burkholderia multivorans]